MDCSKRSPGVVASLPDDSLVEILSRIPIKSLCRFKCVSKAWRGLITDPLNRKKLPQTLEGFFFLDSSCGGERSDSEDDLGSDSEDDFSDSDGGDGEDCGGDRDREDSDSDDGHHEDISSDGGCDDSDSYEGDGEDRISDGGGENSDNGNGDGSGSDGMNNSDNGNGDDSGSDEIGCGSLQHQFHVYFADTLGRSVRLVDSCFPFLTELPGIETISILDDCNGLLLFGYVQESDKSLCMSYIVSNPATEQWVAVPNSYRKKWLGNGTCTSLVFNPAANSHFHLLEIKDEDVIPMQIYSSESGMWSPVGCESNWRGLRIAPGLRRVYANGMLYVVLYWGMFYHIAVIDVEGNKRKLIPVPFRVNDVSWSLSTCYVGLSQGRLHWIYYAELDCDETPQKKQSYKLVIWVLNDYRTEDWVLKHTVSYLELFGKSCCQTFPDYVVAIHPDHNLVFLVQRYNRMLMSYNIDSKEVRHLCTLGCRYGRITPYVPCFSVLSALENEH